MPFAKPIHRILWRTFILGALVVGVSTSIWVFLNPGPVPLLGRLLSLVGASTTVLVCWTIYTLTYHTRQVAREVTARTQELQQVSLRLRQITDNAFDLIAIVDNTGMMEDINVTLERLLGYKAPELLGIPFLDLVSHNHRSDAKKMLDEVFSGRPSIQTQFKLKHKDGQFICADIMTKGIFNAHMEVTAAVVHCRDITARHEIQSSLAHAEQRFKDFADTSSDWLWEIDPSMNFTYMSPGVGHTLGFTADEAMRRLKFTDMFKLEKGAAAEALRLLTQRQEAFSDIEFWTATKSQQRVCLRVSGVPVYDKKGIFIGYRGAATNVTIGKQDQENLTRMATTDQLTGLYNRSRFMQELGRAQSIAEAQNHSGALVVMNLDRFQAINDTHGHQVGDELLIQISKLLRKTMRTTDVLGRLGGDDFGVIMHSITPTEAREKVEDLLEKLTHKKFKVSGKQLTTTLSAGMVMYPTAGRDASQVMVMADFAMYRAKDLGRNRLYFDQSSKPIFHRMNIEWVEKLHHALENDRIRMVYQPMVPTRKGQSLIYEALLRVKDADGTLLPPTAYIEAAEQFGLIHQLDMAIMHRCFDELCRFDAKDKRLMVSINVSGLNIGDARFLKGLEGLLAAHADKVNPSQLIFEMTETAAMRDLSEAKAFVNALKKLGCSFAIDDFGAGFTSFSYIRQLKVDYVKIDGAFIKNIDKSEEDRLFVKALVDLAQGLHIKTIAEFVETKDAMVYLQTLGVDFVQGYYLSKPQPDLDEVTKNFAGRCTSNF